MDLLSVTLFAAAVSSLIAYLPLVIWRGVLRRSSGPSLWRYTCTALSLVFGLGFIGFALGFFGPIFLSPASAQGPLLGIFVTGPLGAVVGLISTWVWFYVDRKSS